MSLRTCVDVFLSFTSPVGERVYENSICLRANLCTCVCIICGYVCVYVFTC